MTELGGPENRTCRLQYAKLDALPINTSRAGVKICVFGMVIIYGLGANLRYMDYFLNLVASPRKKNFVAIMSWGHVLGSWTTIFD